MKTQYTAAEHTYLTEPRINLIKAQLESLLELIAFECDGEPVEIDGFRLKNPADWTGPIRSSAFLNIGSFSSCCNLDCTFCSELGNRSLPWSRSRPMLTPAEVRTYMKYYSKNGRGIFPLWAPSYEHMANPWFFEILRIIRENAPDEYFEFPTNGSRLTETNVNALSELGPLSVMVSLHSTDPEQRRRIMRDPHPEVAINGVKLLNRYRIPFEGSLVPWPTLPLEDIAETLRYLAENNAYRIIINLPSWTKDMSEQPLFDSEAVWERVVAFVEKIRPELSTPVVFGPNLYAEKDSIPRITGLLKNSPGFDAGLKYGDTITAVDDKPVFSQYEARYHIGKSINTEVSLAINRNGKPLKISMPSPASYKYPFTKIVERQVGMVKGISIPEGFHVTDLRRLERIIKKHNPQSVLFLSAKILKPFFEEQLHRFYELGSLKFFIEVPEHRFWGGNIIDGSTYMVGDYVHAIRKFILREGFAPELVIIPSSSFASGGWGRDYLGQTYNEVERLTNIPVAVIQTVQIGF